MTRSSLVPTRRSNHVLAAAGVSGIAGYVVLVVTARVLTPEQNAEFLVFWGALFGVFGVLLGITVETTRAVHSASRHAALGDGRGAPVVLVAAVIGLVVGAVVLLTGLFWADDLFLYHAGGLLVALAVGIVVFAVHCALTGAAAGQSDWGPYSFLVGAEAAVRLALVVLVATVAASVTSLAFATACAAVTWLPLSLLSTRYSAAWHARADVTINGLLARITGTASAAVASALLLVAFPVLLRATSTDAEFAGAAPLILAVSLSRAPLLVPLSSYQNVLVVRVVSEGLHALRTTGLLVLGATVVGAVLAYPAGPFILRLINPRYDLDGAVFSGLVVAAGLIAALTVGGAAALAKGRHIGYAAGWGVATLATVVFLLIPWPLDTRTMVALTLGPLMGLAVHLRALLPKRR